MNARQRTNIYKTEEPKNRMAQQQPTPEQIKEMQEKIAKMSPEELKEFQKKQCIFCHIIAGKVPSKKVYEDEQTFAVLDINPAASGHILLLTKEHYAIMPQLPEETLEHIFLVAKKLSNALLRCLDAKGSNILVTNGVAAGQKAQHFMVHIIPRREKDGVKFELPQRNQPEEMLKHLEGTLSKALGAPKQKKEEFILPSITKKIIEAEHEHHKERKKKQDERQKGKTHEKRDEEKHHDPPHHEKKAHERPKAKEEANLDDIAKLFGAKK